MSSKVHFIFIYLYYLLIQLAVATALVQEIEENFESNELYKAKFQSNNKEDFVEGANRNPLLYLPLVLQKFQVDTNAVEIVGRLLWHQTSKRRNVEAAYRLYRQAESAFPDLAFVKLLRATCLTYLSVDSTAFVDQMEGVKKLNPVFHIRFLLFKRNIEAKSRTSGDDDSKNSTDSYNMDLIAMLEFQKYYAQVSFF
jgi:hypothetical protein